MYYNVVLPVCQQLFAGVVFKQQTAECAQTPGLEQGDLFKTKDSGHEPVPKPHDGEGKEQAEDHNKHKGSYDGIECVHYFTFLITDCASAMLGLMPS